MNNNLFRSWEPEFRGYINTNANSILEAFFVLQLWNYNNCAVMSIMLNMKTTTSLDTAVKQTLVLCLSSQLVDVMGSLYKPEVPRRQRQSFV